MAERIRLLIIDDEKDYVDVLRDRLEFEGFEVVDVQDGESGLQKLREEAFDIVLLDIMMPGLDGFGVYREVQEKDGVLSHAPIIFVTAYGRTLSKKEKELIAGAPFVRKPFDVDELIALIREVHHKAHA